MLCTIKWTMRIKQINFSFIFSRVSCPFIIFFIGGFLSFVNLTWVKSYVICLHDLIRPHIQFFESALSIKLGLMFCEQDVGICSRDCWSIEFVVPYVGTLLDCVLPRLITKQRSLLVFIFSARNLLNKYLIDRDAEIGFQLSCMLCSFSFLGPRL